MWNDERRSGWGPWVLVAGVGAVGVLGLARELRERRRDRETRDETTGGDADADETH